MTESQHSFAEVHAAKCALAGESLRSSGRLRLQVTGWSMLPSVWPGDTLIIERIAADSISAGDIVLFERERLFAHRVVKALADARFLTRGDAMPAADPVVSADELLGRVSLIERNGRSFIPRRRVGVADRIVASLVRSSNFAARIVVGVRDGFQALQPGTS